MVLMELPVLPVQLVLQDRQVEHPVLSELPELSALMVPLESTVPLELLVLLVSLVHQGLSV